MMAFASGLSGGGHWICGEASEVQILPMCPLPGSCKGLEAGNGGPSGNRSYFERPVDVRPGEPYLTYLNIVSIGKRGHQCPCGLVLHSVRTPR
jgi:hypothetical protein